MNLSLSMCYLACKFVFCLYYVVKFNYCEHAMPDIKVYNTPIVNKDYKGKRIDKFLSECFPEISRSQIQRLLGEGNVCCDETVIADNSFKVKEGDSYQ